jgi:hypothetical protein
MCAFSEKLDYRPGPGPHEEWLVTDHQGGFAMGTTSGIRTRKYHSFYAGIAGRAETVFLADIELRFNGNSLWPHLYASPGAPVVYPDPLLVATSFAYEPDRGLPRWRWTLPGGRLAFGIEPGASCGIRLSWKWQRGSRGTAPAPAFLEVRPFWSMRTLHGIGGMRWKLRMEDSARGRVANIGSEEGTHAWCGLEGPWTWREEPIWHERFSYPQEAARGYAAQEDLYSEGVFKVDLAKPRAHQAAWNLSDRREGAHPHPQFPAAPRARTPVKALDFVLRGPAGVCAGYPWFGEWGRDTFIALPGIVAAWGGKDASGWAQEILSRWGAWIVDRGMIPNVLEKNSKPQWDSADGTLWWCHALAALWAQSLAEGGDGAKILQETYSSVLAAAIASIRSGMHRALILADTGLLEVTEPHATWMDARVGGVAVTPRTGALPEINALWFQARCLHEIWSGPEARSASDSPPLEQLGRASLSQCNELDRPNRIFLHSVPLAPSFVLRDSAALGEQLKSISELLWTPVGLRTLAPVNPAYRPSYLGDQHARDQGYHQGPPWAWLGGHYEMARMRLVRKSKIPEIKFVPGASEWSSISGHAAELFDAEPPHAPRGTPAQAWSIACFEEAAARRRLRVDAHLTRVLAQRWLAHLEK